MEKIKKNSSRVVFLAVIALACSWAMLSNAGSLNPSAPPGPTMKTLDEIYTKIDTIEADTRTSIKSSDLPLTISQSGSYYLAETINFATQDTTGITITASDVTIDLNGYALIGPGKATGSSGSGISASGQQITVLNGSVCQWRGSGIALSSSCQVSDVKAINNGGNGISVANDSTVKDCVAVDNNANGISGNEGCVIDNCSANNNAAGIGLTDGAVVTNCSACGNDNDGIRTYSGVISNCVAYGNHIGINGNGNVSISNCSAYDNYDGIVAYEASVVRGCSAYSNSDDGIAGSDALITDNSSTNNGTNWDLSSCTTPSGHNHPAP